MEHKKTLQMSRHVVTSLLKKDRWENAYCSYLSLYNTQIRQMMN